MLQLVDRARREVVVHFSNSNVVGGEIEGDGCRAHRLVAFYQKKGLRRQRFIWFLSLAHKLKLVLVCERHLGCLESPLMIGRINGFERLLARSFEVR
jgi:hypothetical protein